MLSAALALQLVVISNATVLDPDSPTPRRDQVVVVRGTRIEAVSDARTARIPAGARVIDARGKFVIPGMWDMHVHTDISGGRPLLGLYVAAGVTGVRDMNGNLERLRAMQRDVRAGTLAGPRLVVSGPYVIGRALPPALGMPHFVATDSASAARAVDSLVAMGVDFIKVHNWLPPAAHRGAALAARRHGIAFAGHVALPNTPRRAAELGQRSQEHLYAFLNECTSADSVVIARGIPLQRFVMGECTSTSQAAEYAAIARQRSWVTPTLIVQQLLATLAPTILPGDSTAQYYGEALMRRLTMEMELPPQPPPAAIAAGGRLFERRLAVVGALHRAGVPILGGTDSPLSTGGPGASLAGELAYLVRAGLSPREALRTVTTEPARYLSADSLGRVAAGKVADLVVLDGDPFADIANVRRVWAVVANGRVYDATAIEALRVEARRSARVTGTR
jgi:imidazolonepropionase-like amidohydrolase